jgi:hypothetical protein
VALLRLRVCACFGARLRAALAMSGEALSVAVLLLVSVS